MDFAGEYRIAAPREQVWHALNDPDVLKQAIPGCQEIDKESATAFNAKVKARIGPVSAAFRGRVTLSKLDPPRAYTISGEGQGGVAGFAKGGARVELEEVEGGAATLLRYRAEGQVGGKLAQIGARLVEGSAKKMADDFFGRLNELVGAPAAAEPAAAPAVPPEPAPPVAAPPATPAAQPRPRDGAPRWTGADLWIGISILTLIGLAVAAAVMQ